MVKIQFTLKEFENLKRTAEVIYKKIEPGEWFFWSIIPFWRQSISGKRLFEGNPEED